LEKEKQNSMMLDSTESESEETLMNMNNLAILYQEQGRYKEAEALYLECFEKRKATLGLNHSETKNTFHNLKVLLAAYKSQDDNEAARLLEEKLRKSFR
jgi:tetratricopeptide (TPR) repeat protein